MAEPIPSDRDSETETEEMCDEEELFENVHLLDVLAHDGNTDNCMIEQNKNASSSCENGAQGKRRARIWKKKADEVVDVAFINTNTKSAPAISTPFEAFNLFFDDELLDKITYESNLKSVLKGKSINLTADELRVFLGLNILMGYNPMHKMAHYWFGRDDLGVPAVLKAMTRDRFFEILSNLHLNDSSKMIQEDKIYKVQMIVEHLNQTFSLMKAVPEHVSLDKLMIEFEGRNCLKQRDPIKQFELWCLADDSGYIHKFEIYTGGNESKRNPNFGLEENVVLRMSEHLQGLNHKLYFDSFFSSVPLMEELKVNKILACSTIKPSQKDFPTMEQDKSLKRGEFDFRSSSNGIMVYKWMDSKAVHMISNYHGIDITTIHHKQGNGSKYSAVSCPVAIKDYNEHIGGVNIHDKMRHIYRIHHKNVKWWHHIFFGLIDMSIVNSFIIYSETQQVFLSQLEYRRELAQALLTYSQRKTHGVKRRKVEYSVPASVRTTNVGVHLPQFNVSKARCEVCSKNKIESRPTSKCSHCGVNLCCNNSKNCFVSYHTS